MDHYLPSPNKLLGKKPNWLQRLFRSEDRSYWPTIADVLRFKNHMRALDNRMLVGFRGSNGLLFDPSISQYFVKSEEERRRAQILAVKRYYEQQRREEERGSWWKYL